MANAAVALRERGASEVYAIATHALLSGPAVERLNGAGFVELAVTDTWGCHIWCDPDAVDEDQQDDEGRHVAERTVEAGPTVAPDGVFELRHGNDEDAKRDGGCQPAPREELATGVD